jgi:hypothetical protein
LEEVGPEDIFFSSWGAARVIILWGSDTVCGLLNITLPPKWNYATRPASISMSARKPAPSNGNRCSRGGIAGS